MVALATDRERTLWAGAAGGPAGGPPMATDTVLALFSVTKAVTATACLQLAEEGRLDLDAPAGAYAPGLAGAMVIDGFDPDGRPRLRPPRRPVTTRMLLLHTSGFGYDIFNPTCLRMGREHGLARPATATRAALAAPLLFDPGERWEYGIGVDWAGQVVEGIAGRRLGEVVAERILAPLGMTSTGFRATPAMRARRARLSRRDADGRLTPIAAAPVEEPEIDMGGQGLWGTGEDLIRFVRMWLADGMGETGRVLRPETVRMAARDGLAGRPVPPLRTAIPALANDVEFLPGMAKGWALSFLVNHAPAPTGRAAGSLAWGGLANLYFWIDRSTGVGGFWATQLLPFGDPAALAGFAAFETAVYAGLSR